MKRRSCSNIGWWCQYVARNNTTTIVGLACTLIGRYVRSNWAQAKKKTHPWPFLFVSERVHILDGLDAKAFPLCPGGGSCGPAYITFSCLSSLFSVPLFFPNTTSPSTASITTPAPTSIITANHSYDLRSLPPTNQPTVSTSKHSKSSQAPIHPSSIVPFLPSLPRSLQKKKKGCFG